MPHMTTKVRYLTTLLTFVVKYRTFLHISVSRDNVMAKKTELVVKDNRLIEASYRFTLIEQQVVLYAICRSREEAKGLFADLPVTIRAQDFAKIFGMDESNVYGQLKEAMNRMFSREATIHDTDPATGKPRVTRTHWISQSSYVDGAGHIQFIFAPAVIPFITRLGEEGNFTQYKLEKIGRMTSTHAVRLYELLVQYLSIGKRSVEVPWMKEALQVAEQYPRVVDFKKRVVDVAVQQINDLSDLTVSYEQRKTGRAVSHFDFKIKAKHGETKAKAAPIDRVYVEKHARPGESYDMAFRRLIEERGQGRLDL